MAFLAGCGDEAKTSDYYKAHLDEAKARVAECKKMEKMNENVSFCVVFLSRF